MNEETRPEPPSVMRGKLREAVPLRRRYSYVDLASMFRVSTRQVMRWVTEGRMPQPIRAGSRTLFTPEHVAFVEKGLAPPGTYPPSASVPPAKVVHDGTPKRDQKQRDARPRSKPQPRQKDQQKRGIKAGGKKL